jgi:hypothetical protein
LRSAAIWRQPNSPASWWAMMRSRTIWGVSMTYRCVE